MTKDQFDQAQALQARIKDIDDSISQWESAREHGIRTMHGTVPIRIDKALETGFAGELIDQAIDNLTRQRDEALTQFQAL